MSFRNHDEEIAAARGAERVEQTRGLGIVSVIRDDEEDIPSAIALHILTTPTPEFPFKPLSAQPCGCDPGLKPNPHLCEQHRNPPRDPLDDASQSLQMAVADFLILIEKADSSARASEVWTRLRECESLVNAANDAAAQKANTF